MNLLKAITEIDLLLFELWYTDDSKENYNPMIFKAIETLYKHTKELIEKENQ